MALEPMQNLNNLPLDNSELRQALEALNDSIQKDSDNAHYLLQWVVSCSGLHYNQLLAMAKYVDRQADYHNYHDAPIGRSY